MSLSVVYLIYNAVLISICTWILRKEIVKSDVVMHTALRRSRQEDQALEASLDCMRRLSSLPLHLAPFFF
jgi:hypothetical protein